MFFSVGNLLTLIIVIGVLVVYRQLDKNNRSLDKVKRYSDKIKEQLDGFVEEKSAHIKDLAIELDVHQKAAKEVFKRIKGIEENLDQRANNVDSIRERIDQYDQSLQNLSDMTARVDENLRRLQDESEFVDKVGRRLKDVSVNIDQLENRLPEIEENFKRDNMEKLQQIEQEVFQETDDRIAVIQQGLGDAEKMVNNFTDYMNSLEARKDTISEKLNEEMRYTFEDYSRKVQEFSNDHHETFSRKIEDMLDETEKKGQGLIGRLNGEYEKFDVAFENAQTTLDEKLVTFQDRADKVEHDYQQRINSVAEQGKNLESEIFVSLKEHIENRSKEVKGELLNKITNDEKEIESAREELSKLFGEVRSETTVWRTEIQKFIDDNSESFHRQYNEFASRIDEKTQDMIQRAESTQERQKQDLDEFIDQISIKMGEFEGKVNNRMGELETTLSQKEYDFKQNLEDAEQKNRSFADKVVENLAGYTTGLETKVNESISDIEMRISEYENNIAYRFTEIEGINNDIDDLEKNLHTAMDNVTKRVHSEFEDFAEQQRKQRELDRQKAFEDIQEIRSSMDELEKSLNELKTRAYDNVSEKLQVFEDDFFSDLKVRSENMEEKFSEWKEEINQRLTDLGIEYENKRSKTEQYYSNELKEKLSALQNQTYEQFDKFEGQVQSFQENIEQRMDLSENSIANFEQAMKKEIDEAKENSKIYFEKELATYSGTVNEQLKKFERDMDGEIKELGDNLAEGRKDLMSLIESAKSDVTVWQAKVLQQMQEAESEVNEQFTSFKTEATTNIGAIKDDFVSQREDLILQSREERDRLKTELKQISEQVSALEEELKRKSESAIEAFQRDHDGFMLEFQRKTRDIQVELDQRIKDFRAAVHDTREKIDSVQKKLNGKIDENYKILNVNLQEIEKKQKNFINQTKVFERADSLKATLQQNIEDLKGEITSVEAQTKEIKEAERKFDKIKKLGDEVSSKLTRFLSEKRRIEEMEGDFKKLINMSQAVDLKLDQVTGSHDELQKIQAEIRHLSDLEKDVFQKYERLEEKKGIIESTMQGVDKNFSNLEKMEHEIESLEESVNTIPKQIDDIRGNIHYLSENKEKADDAMEKLQSLDATVKEIEEKIDAMQKAREWLARTETRLEKISKQANDQVKLLGDLIKNSDTEAVGKGEGAPPAKVRDMVVKLARQGWGVKEIAQTTKLSRGEVELILELLPKV